MNAEDEDQFARITHRLELDLAADTRDLGPLTHRARPRPGLSALLAAGAGLALLLSPAEVPTTPCLYATGVLVALTYLTQLTRATAQDWSHHSHSDADEPETEDNT